MTTETDKLVILVTKGIDSELSSIASTIANGGLNVCVFLTSATIDLVRCGGQQLTHVSPLDPLTNSIADFQKLGGTSWACPPCVQARGYAQPDLLESLVIVGSSALHAAIKEGAATLSF